MLKSISPQLARRLTVASQLLDGRPPAADKNAILSTIRRLGCVQLDPINVVARSPLLVLWSRLGHYSLADLESLLWEEKALFEYWAHAASIVLTGDFPLYLPRMRQFARGGGRWEKRVLNWIEANRPFRQAILRELAERGPLFTSEIESRNVVVPWQSGGWTNSRNITVMLAFLWEQGEIMVTRRQGRGFGLKKQWGLLAHHLPQWAGQKPWPERQVVTLAAQKALRALGVGTAAHIKHHFIRGRYPGLDDVLAELERDGLVLRVSVAEEGRSWPGPWYIHADHLPLLEQIESGEWQPRTTLLSPFDNLICDRQRTELLFDFSYRSEIYTPKAKRQYGYYVMPILHGDRLIGRIDPKLDRKQKVLHVHAIHLEPEVTVTAEMWRAIRQAITDLAHFLNAEAVEYGQKASLG